MSSNSEYTNDLIHETSPYLLQHAHNPVDWHAWGEKALEKAKDENKLLIISIGYSSCHWCHVMEHESFEDKQVAGIMNKDYVSVKVDREERPDIDQVYMNAAYLLTGSGGWPLNVIALSDARPVYAGTYFPKEHWIKVLEHFIELMTEQPALLEEQADKIEKGLVDMDILPKPMEPQPFKNVEIESFTASIINNIDYQKGGTRGAPKFPMPVIYSYLLHHHAITGDSKSLLAVDTTLTRMAMGGIYDHIGGGFARYSVDDRWFLPHFEKMLYDNAQLISLYSMAYQQSKNPLYQHVVYECTGFIQREMTSPLGAFYAALDADSEGVEGKYYTWTSAEISNILGKDAERFIEFFNVSEEGNWENGKNILYINKVEQEYLFSKELKHHKAAMLDARSKRVRPGLDNKVLTSWNALMLNAYVDAYRAFNDEVFLERALLNAKFLEERMVQDDSSILRNYMNDQASINGFLDDYAFSIWAFINLYQATFQEKWLHLANRLVEYVFAHFSDDESSTFFYTSDEDMRLITRSRELSDNVMPSSNSQMAKNLFILGTFLEKRNYIIRASQIMMTAKEKMLRHPSFHGNWGMMMLYLSNKPAEVVIMGNDCVDMRAEFDSNYIPQILFAGGTDEGSLALLQQRLVKDQTTVYVCRDKTCKLPVTSVREALKQLEGWTGTI